VQKNAAAIAQYQIDRPIFLAVSRQDTSQHNTVIATKRITPVGPAIAKKNA